MTAAGILSDFFRQRRDLKEISEPKAIQADELFVFGGWIRTTRTAGGGRFCFINISDGSTIMPVQIVIDDQLPNYDEIKRLTAGASIIGRGTITKSPAAGQEWEIVIKASGDKRHDGNGTQCSWPDTELYALARNTEKQGIHITGLCDGSTYPLAKKSHNKEFLRQIQHLRPRTVFFQSVIRLRSLLSRSIHKFFEERGYQYIQTPIITCADAEGGADLFWVSSPAEIEHYAKKVDGVVKHPYFFSRPAYLTCSGQLSVESFACGLTKTYTFGPTFRSEQSHTNKHLSEFWMIEPEIAFADLQLVIETATAAIKYCIDEALRMCRLELTWLQEHLVETSDGLESGFLITRLERLSNEDVVYLPYKEALKKLKEYYMSAEGRKHCGPTGEPPALDFGEDLSSEMERLLTNDIFPGKAVAVVRWPRDIKAFYMKRSEAPDEDCCESVDILYPQVGELIGGSAREDDQQALIEAIKSHGLNTEQYLEYIDLRKYGTVPHGGFGIGFERLVMLVTGVQNIRDVVPYPRTPGQIMG